MIKLRCVVSDEITEVTVDGVTLYSCQGFIQGLVTFAWSLVDKAPFVCIYCTSAVCEACFFLILFPSAVLVNTVSPDSTLRTYSLTQR